MNSTPEEQFDSAEAAQNPIYVTDRREASEAFVTLHTQVDDVHFTEALAISRVLGRSISRDVLEAALQRSGEIRSKAIFYLAEIKIDGTDELLIQIANEELQNEEVNTRDFYWIIKALMRSNTPRAKFYLKGLKSQEKVTRDIILSKLIGEIG